MTYIELLTPHEAVPANPQWRKLRAEGVSASEIAAVMGLSPWHSPFSLYWSKANGWEQDDNNDMRAGRYAEDAIADWYADECDPNENLAIRRAGLYAHMERPWQLATPDRLLCEDRICGVCDISLPREACTCDLDLIGLLECKYVIGGWDGWGQPGTDEVPVYYRAQCLWQLDVMGVDEVHLAAWHGADFRVYIVRRDEKDLRIMRAAAGAFIDRLACGEPPDIDEHTATLRTLKTLHPDLEDRTAAVTAETAAGYRRARAMKARAEAQVALFEARLRAEIGTARKAADPDGAFVASRSIYEVGESVRAAYTVDRLNPARSRKS